MDHRARFFWFCFGVLAGGVLLSQTRVIPSQPMPRVEFVTVPMQSAEPLTIDPEPEPRDENERILFSQMGRIAENRAAKVLSERGQGLVYRWLEAVLDDASDQADGKKSAGGIAALLGSKLVALITKVAKFVIEAIVGAAIIALVWKFWPWLTAGFITAVTIIAGPAGWAGAKWGRKE